MKLAQFLSDGLPVCSTCPIPFMLRKNDEDDPVTPSHYHKVIYVSDLAHTVGLNPMC